MAEELIKRYIETARRHGEGTRTGDYKKANRAYDALARLLQEITAASCDEDLFELYDDDEPWVQSWAAAHTLEIDEQRAVKKLQELMASGLAHVSIDEKYILQEWRSGALRFRE